MSYLIAPEFKRFIQTDNLNSVINNDGSILIDAILDAQDIATENLVQKYLIVEEMSSTDAYDHTEVYPAGSRVYLDAPAYDGALTYALGVLVSKDKIVYKNSTAIVAPEVWNPAHWTSLGPQFQILYVPIPQPEFQVKNIYKVGDHVFRLGKVYICAIATLAIDHETLLQAFQYALVPQPNIFPEDPIYGTKFWGTGTSATVAAGVLPTGWTVGDNRSRNLVRHLIAIALYIIHDRISPRMIPLLREARYKEAMKWLENAREGNITADIAAIQPRSGGRIRWGSNIKNINSY